MRFLHQNTHTHSINSSHAAHKCCMLCMHACIDSSIHLCDRLFNLIIFERWTVSAYFFRVNSLGSIFLVCLVWIRCEYVLMKFGTLLNQQQQQQQYQLINQNDLHTLSDCIIIIIKSFPRITMITFVWETNRGFHLSPSVRKFHQKKEIKWNDDNNDGGGAGGDEDGERKKNSPFDLLITMRKIMVGKYLWLGVLIVTWDIKVNTLTHTCDVGATGPPHSFCSSNFIALCVKAHTHTQRHTIRLSRCDSKQTLKMNVCVHCEKSHLINTWWFHAHRNTQLC